MARLEYQNKTYTNHNEIKSIMADHGVPFETWGVRGSRGAGDDDILALYKDHVDRLMTERNYITADLVALNPDTPNLDKIVEKFDKEHHHLEDEVRFTVEGEGIFEIATDDAGNMKFMAEPGDLIVIPAGRRHSFYLTEKRKIRCIRLFKTKEGWEAIYEKPQGS